MSFFYDLNSPSPFPPPEDEEDSNKSIIFNPRSESASSSVCPIFFSSSGKEENQVQEQKQEVDTIAFSPTGSNEESSFASSSYLAHDEIKHSDNHSFSGLQEAGDRQKFYIGSVNWMSSKMRLMKKMMSSDQTIASNPIRNDLPFRIRQQSPYCDGDHSNNSLNNKIRVCSDCNTTKTPLWRSGPKGPKSLCNACGIRQRKARRAMAAAAAAANGGLSAMETSTRRNTTKIIKEKRSGGREYTAQYKKRCKLKAPVSRKAIRFDEFTMISLSKISALHQVFPQVEKEAALLLMALSNGLLLG